MSVLSRARFIARMKTHTALDALEQPVEVLDYAVAAQQELLTKVKRGLIEVATSRQRLQYQSDALSQRIPSLQDQAERAMAAGREDLARLALERKQAALVEIARIQVHIEELTAEEATLATAARQLAARVDAFKIRRTVSTARYEAAEAHCRINESLSGVAGDLADLSAAIGRAEDRTERLRARGAAIDALISGGAFDIAFGTDPLEDELRSMAARQAVEAELAALRQSPEAGV